MTSTNDQPDQQRALADGIAPRSLRVLVADDERDSVLTLTMLLQDEGHEVRGVSGGKQALSSLSGFDPDVVLLDIALPELSGWEVARQIRKRRGRERPMLIGISGEYRQGADRILSQILGFDHYLLKNRTPQARCSRSSRRSRCRQLRRKAV